jgi:sugar phosphate isomerase/epimerase
VPSTPELLFWPGSLNAAGYDGVLAAAHAGGFSRLAVSPLMLDQLLTAGMKAADIVDVAAEQDVVLTQLDGVASWAPLWGQGDSAIRERFNFSAERCLDLAEAVGLDSILLAGAFDRGALPLDVLIDSFGIFCDAAAARSMRVELEFVPFWGIPSLGMAWDIVSGADRPDSGLLVDTWHLQKGSEDFEADLLLLAAIPADRLANVQLADAVLAPQADSLWAEGRYRRFPGDGELAIHRIVRTVVAAGGLRRIGTEIFGPAIDELSLEAAGRRSAGTTLSSLR